MICSTKRCENCTWWLPFEGEWGRCLKTLTETPAEGHRVHLDVILTYRGDICDEWSGTEGYFSS